MNTEVSNPEAARMCKMFQHIDPELYARFFGRHYNNVQQWCDWRTPAYVFGAALAIAVRKAQELPDSKFAQAADGGWQPQSRDSVTVHHAVTGSLLAQHNNPMFFVTPELLQAVLQSNLPPEVDWRAMRLPFEAATFILPKGGLMLETHEVPFLTYARKRRREPLFGSQTQVGYGDIDGNFSVHTMAADTLASYDFTLLSPFNAEAVEMQTEKARPILEAGKCASFAKRDSHQLFMQVVFNLLFVMDARPDLVETARKLKTVRWKKRELRDLWQPNVVGARYRLKSEPAGGTHASPRMHWRRGHYRLQGYGKRLRFCICGHDVKAHSQGKAEPTDAGFCTVAGCDCAALEVLAAKFAYTQTIWIEPVLVNLKSEDAADAK